MSCIVKISPGPSKNNGIPTKSEGNFVMELDELGNVDIVLETISQLLAAVKIGFGSCIPVW